jgi:phage-related protein
MIIFDGVTLNSAANVMIEDIRVNPIQFSEITRPRAIRGGSDFVRSRAGTRTVQITFAILDEDKITRQAALLAISQWAKTDKEYKLELPGHPEHYLMAVCTNKPEPSLRQWWESRLKLVFTCFDNPYWNAKAERTASCGTAFFVLGDAPPLMRIERTVSGSAASNQSYSDGTNTMTFSAIPVGDMVIDLNRQTAQVGNNSIMQYYQPSGRFIVPKVGTQTITGTGTVKYRERWQ